MEELITNTLKFVYMNMNYDLMLEFVQIYSELMNRADSNNSKCIVKFMLKVYNAKIAFKLEIKNQLKLGLAYKANLKSIMKDCCFSGLQVQSNFWKLHHILTQK